MILLVFGSSDGDEIEEVIVPVPTEYSMEEARAAADVFNKGKPVLLGQTDVYPDGRHLFSEYRAYIG